EIDHIAPLKVHDNGAIALSFAPGPVVNPDESGRRRTSVLELLDATEQRVRTGRHRQVRGEPRAGLTAESIGDRLVGLAKPDGRARMRLRKPRQAFREDAARTVRLGA